VLDFRAFNRRFVAAVSLLAATACSSVSEVYVIDDYESTDRTQTYRVHVVTQHVPAADRKVAELCSLIAQRWVNHHRDFIVKKRSLASKIDGAWCDGGMAAVLHLKPEFKRIGDLVQTRVVAVMERCSEGSRIWSAQAQGTWDVDDDELKATTDRYAKELGESVRPWVPATFRILRDLLDTLPRPKLVNDDDVLEKIELED
jgi:probable lipoprotein (TIGR04455 family)